MVIRKGKRFSHWTVLDPTISTKANGYIHQCRCDCGNIRYVQKKYLLHGRSKSCGCHGIYPGIDLPNGMRILKVLTVPFSTTRRIKVRCKHGVTFTSRLAAGSTRAKYCPCEWRAKCGMHKKTHWEAAHWRRTREYNCWRMMRQRCTLNTLKAYKWYGARGIKVCKRWDKYENFLSDMGRCPPNYSIDRIDVKGNYAPSNCRWANIETQARNKRNSLTESSVRMIREDARPQKIIAAKYNISQSMVSMIKHQKRWTLL